MNQKEFDGYIESLKGRSDRELMESNLYYQRIQAEYLKSINGNVFLLVALAILGGIDGILISLS